MSQANCLWSTTMRRRGPYWPKRWRRGRVQVEAFASGQAAVERGRQAQPDVVLTDIRTGAG